MIVLVGVQSCLELPGRVVEIFPVTFIGCMQISIATSPHPDVYYISAKQKRYRFFYKMRISLPAHYSLVSRHAFLCSPVQGCYTPQTSTLIAISKARATGKFGFLMFRLCATEREREKGCVFVLCESIFIWGIWFIA